MFSFIRNHGVGVQLALALVLAAVVGCGGADDESDLPVVFTDDEIYLIETYTDVKRARSFYPHQPLVADSLFAHLEQAVDTLRIANAIATLNTAPQRWIPVFEEIETRLRATADERKSERTRDGS